MKSLSIFLLIVLVLGACKKESQQAPGYLVRTFRQGLLEREYVLDVDKKPVRLNLFTTGQGQSVPAGFRFYQYNAEGLLQDVTLYNKSKALSQYYTLTYNASRQLTRMDAFGSDEVMNNYYLFKYDGQGRMNIMEVYNTTKKIQNIYYGYDPKSNLVSIARHGIINNVESWTDSTTIKYGERSLPAHWHYFEMIPLNFPGDDLFLLLNADSYTYKFKGTPIITTITSGLNKQYNEAGLPVKQHIVIKPDDNSGSTEYDHSYEYLY
jgi:uncharacterized protein YcfL